MLCCVDILLCRLYENKYQILLFLSVDWFRFHVPCLWSASNLHNLFLQTYNADAQIGESSACATALMCGVKANFETVGLDTKGRFENCLSSFSSKVPSLIDWAQEEGESAPL